LERQRDYWKAIESNLLEYSSTDADVTCEWALLVNVVSFNGGLGGLETYRMPEVNTPKALGI
jgi:hypothetical protein